jgi:hypothetical protein
MLQPRSLANRITSAGLRRRPSAAMLVALLALFLAAGGASYAAVSMPANSVGNAQIQNGAVSNFKLASEAVGFRKIIPGTIGAVRVNKNAVQLRVGGACVGGSQAITSIQNTGRVTCGPTSPSEYDGGQSSPVSITSATTATPITGVSLPGNSSFLVLANPQVQVSGAATTSQHVIVNCTLAVGPSSAATQTRSVSFDVNSSHEQQYATLPLEVPVGPSTNAQAAQVTCVSTVSGDPSKPTVTAAATIDAIQTATNTTLASTVDTPPPPPTTTTTTPTTTTTATP